MTFEEFEQLPDEPGKIELLQGELIRIPPAEAVHQEEAERLAELLRVATESARLAGAAIGKVHHEMGYQLSKRSWLQPDVSIRHPNQPLDRYYQGSPMMVVSERFRGRLGGKSRTIPEIWRTGSVGHLSQVARAVTTPKKALGR
jgi:hypothetical protein